MARFIHENMFFEKFYVNGFPKLILTGVIASTLARDLVIPSSINGFEVTQISSGVFRNVQNLVSVKCPDTVSKIGYGAFNGCIQLETFEVYKTQPGFVSYLEIDAFAFWGCKNLRYFKAMQIIREVETEAFANCERLSIFDAKVRHVAEYSFANCCKLKQFRLANNATWRCNSFCDELTDIYFDGLVVAEAEEINAISDKIWHCRDYFNLMDLAFAGVTIKVENKE